MTAVLECSGLRRTYGDLVAVDDVSFEIAAGETYGLLGPNGAGKTTTISMLCGLLATDAGSVHVAGHRMGPRAMDAKRAVGLVPQQIALQTDLTGRENLRFFGRLQGMADLPRRMDEVLELVGLTERGDDRVDAYSGGMQRRLNIAVGLLHQPTLLVLDEPTVGVDPQSRDNILASVEELTTTGMSVLYTTHYMEEAERLCDRVGVMDNGAVIAEGTRRELVAMLGEADRVRLELDGDVAAVATRVEQVEGVATATPDGTELHVEVVDAAARLPAILAAASDQDARTLAVEVVEPDLEAVFLHLTGRALRD